MLISPERERNYQHFKTLKLKYAISCTAYYVSALNPLYPILQKLESQIRLTSKEFAWLQDNELLSKEILAVYHTIEGAFYQQKYKQTGEGSYLSQAKQHFQNAQHPENVLIQKKREQQEKQKRERAKAREAHIQVQLQNKAERLKRKYQISAEFNETDDPHLPAILQKLEAHTHVTSEEFLWLHEHRVLTPKVRQAYHISEASYYEAQYQQTGNLWNLVNASSHWRGAEKSTQALHVTNPINIGTIQEHKLKSAILTTRGGAFRDLQKRAEAEHCADQAMQYYPQTYQPYTLKGAICYDRRDYLEGDSWFQEAIKRGAAPKDIDTEILRVVQRTKGKERQQLITHLLSQDKIRYAWVKKFMPSLRKNGKFQQQKKDLNQPRSQQSKQKKKQKTK